MNYSYGGIEKLGNVLDISNNSSGYLLHPVEMFRMNYLLSHIRGFPNVAMLRSSRNNKRGCAQ
jgi:hypothetical protein